MSLDEISGRLADTRLPSETPSVAERRAERRAQQAATDAPKPSPARSTPAAAATGLGTPPPEPDLREQVRQLRDDLESAGRAVDEYAAAKLAAEADSVHLRTALGRATTAAQVLREQIGESEDRATAAAGDALLARRERDATIAELEQIREALHQALALAREDRDARLAAETAYRHERAQHAQTTQSFEELRALTRRSPEPVEVLTGSVPHRVGELVIEQIPNGTRVIYTSRKPAHITFGGVEVDLDGTQAKTR